MSRPLSASLRHGYGVGAFSIAIVNTAILFFLLKYLVDELRFSPAVAGGLLLVGKLWDAVMDPLVGRISDRTRSSMGARRFWIASGCVPFLVLFAGLWWGVPSTGWWGIAAYCLVMVLYSTSFSAVVVPYGALTPTLTDDYDERTRLNGTRMAWSMVGGITVGVLMPLLHEWTGSWRVAGMSMSLLAAPPLLLMLWATRGRDHTTPVEPSASLWSVLRVRSFRRVAVLYLAAWSTIAVLGGVIPFYVQHHLRHPQLLDVLLATLQLAALTFIVPVVKLSNRLEKHVAYALSIGTWALVMLGLALVPEGLGWQVLPVAALAGVGVAAAHVLPWSMLPDVVEIDAAAHGGVERAGSFYGMLILLEKVATAAAMGMMGVALELGGYVQGAEVQSEAARNTIRLIIGPIPGVVLVAAALFAWRYPPVTRQMHQDVLARLRPR